MKRILILALILTALPTYASIWYLQVPIGQLDAYMSRLDVLKGPSPYTLHYTQPIYSPMATVTTALLPVDERSQSVLTADEWAGRLTGMPPEFVTRPVQ